MKASLVLVLIAVASLLSACEPPPPTPPERIRAVKTLVVSERAGGQIREFPGTLEPVDTASLGFEVGGLVQQVRVEAGSRIQQGDLLASLDKSPFELAVASAKAGLAKAEAQLREKEAGYARQQRIQTRDPGATSQQAVDQARAAYESAREAVSYARAQLGLSQRDLEKTDLRAPFTGVISERHIQPFEEVVRGKPVFELYIEGALEVVARVPEQWIGKVFVGLPGEVTSPAQPGKTYRAQISEVANTADVANAYPIKASLADTEGALRPGMTAVLQLRFGDAAETLSYLVPVSALWPDDQGQNQVWRFDPATSTVTRQAVQVEGAIGNQAIIREGVAPGDLLVVAGVSFLRQGQRVRLLDPGQRER